MFTLPVEDQIVLRLHDDFRLGDFYALIDRNREHLGRFLEWTEHHQSAENTRSYVQMERRAFAAGNAIVTRIYDGDQVIGSVGLTLTNPDWKIGEIGYWLGAEYSGRGYVTRAARTLLDYGFGVLGLHKIVLRAIRSNTHSIEVARRLGLYYQGSEVKGRLLYGVYHDYEVYYALASDWHLPEVRHEFACRPANGLELRILEPRHAAELYHLTEANRTYLREWLPWLDGTTSVQDSRGFIESGLRQYGNHDGLQLGIWYRGVLCGAIGYHFWDFVAGKTEIGYWLAQSHTGKGIMTRSVAALIDYAFDVLGMHRIEIPCAVHNQRSCAIPQRLGFTHEGVLRSAEWLYDHYVDWNMYALLRHEWKR
jgi:ribosomal-protein-serine acetyltransferase